LNLIFDNIIFSLQQSGGISSYWYEILSRAIIDNDLNIKMIDSQKSSSNIFRNKLSLEGIDIEKYNTNILSRILPMKLKDSSNSVFHSSYYRYLNDKSSKVITTVHDFIQENINSSNVSLNSIMKRRAIINSDILIAISENTKSDILNYFPKINPNSIHVIYNGVSNDYFPLNKTLSEYSYNSILFVGSRANYKNFDFVVEVISKFEHLNLNIVGSKLNIRENNLLRSKLPTGRWNIFVNPSNSELNLLYNSSSLLFYPSSYEGFGIPVIEAMKAGCPVLALNKSSIPEISGNAALLLDKLSIDDFYNGICHILLKREEFVERGINNASRFSWDSTYLQTVNLYKN
jgi:mannosyltransferase